MTSRSKRELAAVALAAVALRAAFLLAAGPERLATPDTGSYLAPAASLARSGAFESGGAPETYRTPGYPLFLAPFAASEPPRLRAAVWAQAALGAATAAAVYLAGLALWDRPRAALLAALAQAADFVTIVHTQLLVTETLFTFLFAGGLLAAARARGRPGGLAAAGLLFGAAALTRPVGLYFIVPAAAAVLAGPRRGAERRAAAFLLAAALLPAAWSVRNGARAGVWALSSLPGENLLFRAASVRARATGEPFESAREGLLAGFEAAHPEGFESPRARAKALGRWSAGFLAAHPVSTAALMLRDLAAMLAGNSMKAAAWLLRGDPAYDPASVGPRSEGGLWNQAKRLAERHPGLGAALAAYLFFLGAAYLLAVAGLAGAWREGRRWAAVWAALPVLYFFAVSAGSEAHARSRVPAMPALFLLAGRGLDGLLRKR